MKALQLFLLVFVCTFSALGQTSADIIQELERLKSPYRVLYLAAHPDDENTRLISYLTGELHARTAYLSLTRGSGGQNLIGSEKGPLLGLLRTEELMSARRIDGAEQFFTRAIDFGYSKTSKETFDFWNRERILEDVSFVVRYFKPHVIINRFPDNNYAGHGHHQASAHLSNDVFKSSGDPTKYPDQVKELGIWNVGSMYFNSSSWWDKSLPERAKNDVLIKEINIGTYNPTMGYSYNEISAFSRSQHKSQGFGSSPKKGDQFEYLEHINGIHSEQLLSENLLDSIDQMWLPIQKSLDSITAQFDPIEPTSILGGLLEVKRQIEPMAAAFPRYEHKMKYLHEIIGMCMGLSLEINSEEQNYFHGDQATFSLKILNRCNVEAIFLDVQHVDDLHSWNRRLTENEILEDTFIVNFDSGMSYSNPYWLNEMGSFRYKHAVGELKRPDADADAPSAIIRLAVDGDTLSFKRQISYRWTDRVKGGLSKPIRILPSITLAFDQHIYFIKDSVIRGNVFLNFHNKDEFNGDLEIYDQHGDQLSVVKNLSFKAGEHSARVEFDIKKTFETEDRITLQAVFKSNGNEFRHDLKLVEYDHIHPQMALLPTQAYVVPVHFHALPKKIAYLPGPDNEMIDYLRLLGCEINEITEQELMNASLSDYDVLLFGIRSINVNPDLQDFSQQIQEFTKKGGITIVQYQTSRGINPLKMAPYPFEISRNRVTDEKAQTKILRPEHKIINEPYALTGLDFNGWNQERGLYFAEERAAQYVPLLSWHDPDELDQFGGLIVGDYGKGAFIYTGVSFFRHIPAGVPGSYKLLLNLLSYEP